MTIRKGLGLLSITGALLVGLYLTAFVWRLDIFSAAVRDDTHGWLGPAMRGDPHLVDIGKIYYYEGTDFSSYRMFRPLCRAWLWVMGF